MDKQFIANQMTPHKKYDRCIRKYLSEFYNNSEFKGQNLQYESLIYPIN